MFTFSSPYSPVSSRDGILTCDQLVSSKLVSASNGLDWLIDLFVRMCAQSEGDFLTSTNDEIQFHGFYSSSEVFFIANMILLYFLNNPL